MICPAVHEVGRGAIVYFERGCLSEDMTFCSKREGQFTFSKAKDFWYEYSDPAREQTHRVVLDSNRQQARSAEAAAIRGPIAGLGFSDALVARILGYGHLQHPSANERLAVARGA